MGSFKSFYIFVWIAWELSVIPILGFKIGQHCATLFRNSNFEGGEGYKIDESSGLRDTYLTSCKAWSVFSSFQVESGCSLRACSESNFGGVCREFTKSLASLPPSFQNILSVSCSCPKACSCEDVYNTMQSSCARAYVSDGGCNKCESHNVDLKETTWSYGTFLEEFQNNVSSLMVKPGCKLTVYDEPDLNGASEVVKCFSENWTRPVRSYQCSCDSERYPTPCQLETPYSRYVPSIDIPESLDGIFALMKSGFMNHPGLLSAVRSHRRKRSTKNAYILLVGSEGAGKASIITKMFKYQNVTFPWSVAPLTEDIREFIIPVKVVPWGIKNSELRLIDTPELGSSQGLDKDARSLAILEEFLDGHEELKDRIPNCVLIFHKFTDDKYANKSSPFVRMILGLDSLSDRIIDKKRSNVLFVFSSSMSDTEFIRRDQSEKLGSFKKLIKEYTQFPRPFELILADSSVGSGFDSGPYRLPNGDYYHSNKLIAMEEVAARVGDTIGHAVFQSVRISSETFNITCRNFNIRERNSTKTTKYLATLNAVTNSIERTEVADKLALAFDKMDQEMKTRFPESLYYLQNSLKNLNYKTPSDLPQTPSATVKLLTNLQQNDAVLFLLKEALGISPPTFLENIVAGHSYNILKDHALPMSPFDMTDLQLSDFGYMIPCFITSNVEFWDKTILHFFDHLNEYKNERMTNSNLRVSIPLERFTGAVLPGYNIVGDFMPPEGKITTTITGVREYRKFKLVMNERFRLADEFVKIVTSLHPYNSADFKSVEQWNSFFDKYGTHVVESVYGGGRIEVELKTKNQYCPKVASDVMSFYDLMDYNPYGVATNSSFDNKGYSINLFGGHKELHTKDLTKLPIQGAADLLEKWEESLVLSPTILKNEIKLRPITEITRLLGNNISVEIGKTANLLFNLTSENYYQSYTSFDVRREVDKRLENYIPYAKLFEKLRIEFGESNESFREYQRLILSLKEAFKTCDIKRTVMLTEMMELLILQHRKRIERRQRDNENFIKQQQLEQTKNTKSKQLFMTFMETLRSESKKAAERFHLYQRLSLSMKESVRVCEKQRGIVHIELMESLILQNRVDNRGDQRQHAIFSKHFMLVAAANGFHDECNS